jgi:hypothetical protein
MNRIITTVISMFASFVVLNGATAQQHAVRAVIPFDFSVEGTQLPAGTYTIATKDGLTSITENYSGKFTFVTVAPAIDNLPNDSKLIFSTYGGQHFLRKVLCPGANMSLELVPSKDERIARVQTGSNRAQPGNNSGD